ncbi:MAG: methyltransferase domain-containing protein [Methylococcus sp.]|nr:methyltransferase domain-containing protein [Methylococcus sp.]
MSAGVDWLREWLAAAGLEPRALGEAAVECALKRRFEATGCDEAAYREKLSADAEEGSCLMEAVLVPETWFFREPPAFEALAEAAARHLSDGRATPFRVLSLGCSTGEEPWSIAIALREAGLSGPAIRVEALDLSGKAIQTARAGIYGGRSFRNGGDDAWRNRYFDALDARRYRVKDALRRDVEFRLANIAEGRWQAQGLSFDAVFCRNVLIYFRPEAKARIVAQCREVLAPGGLLVLGHADGIGEFAEGFVRHGSAGAFSWIRREAGAPLRSTASAGSPRPAPKPSRPRAERRRPHPEGLVRAGSGCAAGDPPLPPLVQARALADRGDYAGAERLCLDCLAKHPQDPEVHALLGMVMAASNREDEAMKYFRRALYLAPSHGESLLHMAALHERRGDGERARHYLGRSSSQREGRD